MVSIDRLAIVISVDHQVASRQDSGNGRNPPASGATHSRTPHTARICFPGSIRRLPQNASNVYGPPGDRPEGFPEPGANCQQSKEDSFQSAATKAVNRSLNPCRGAPG